MVVRDADTLALFSDFRTEAEEHLVEVERAVLSPSPTAPERRVIDGWFRGFHSIKGLASFFELEDIVRLAHATETALSGVRDGTRVFGPAAYECIADVISEIRRLIEVARVAFDKSELVPRTTTVEPLAARLARPTWLPESGAASAQPSADEPHSAALETLKVPVTRVDSIVEMVGELLILQSMISGAAEAPSTDPTSLRRYFGQLSKLSRELQTSVMRMRMVPVGGLFQKARRMCRDLGKKTGKDVQLVTRGEGIEVDRSVAERLEDPLVHLLRNAVDHGIESPAERAAAGKTGGGTLTLTASSEGGKVVLELSDDGKGLRREVLIKRAMERGLIAADAVLTDQQAWELICLPGFSTAAQVTDLSGRGVGMDVVKRNVEAMHGRVLISSVPGRGTSFKLILPLTLAVIDGMIVTTGEERYVVPSLSIIESLPLELLRTRRIGVTEWADFRGESVPVVRLASMLGAPTGHDGLAMIVEAMGRRVALVVDAVVAQQHIVVKPLERSDDASNLFTGAAILADGRISLILDVDRLGVGALAQGAS